MRETDWAPARQPEGALVARSGFSARARAGLGRTLVSGDIGAAIATLAPGAPILGLYERAPKAGHALRIARDRALVVTPAPIGAEGGWRDGWSATSVDDGWATIDVEGEGAGLVLCQGCAADLSAGSASAAVLFAGFRVLLARASAGFSLHVERPWLEALSAWLDGA